LDEMMEGEAGRCGVEAHMCNSDVRRVSISWLSFLADNG
jgi:hypothetical protein